MVTISFVFYLQRWPHVWAEQMCLLFVDAPPPSAVPNDPTHTSSEETAVSERVPFPLNCNYTHTQTPGKKNFAQSFNL